MVREYATFILFCIDYAPPMVLSLINDGNAGNE